MHLVLPDSRRHPYGDVFFDLEGDPFVDEGGLEFLFGYAFKDAAGSRESHWSDGALSRVDEKSVFERFVDFVIARLETLPGSAYLPRLCDEPAALKRLMGRYVTRENEIDRMLLAGVFIDLYAVVRHAIRASVESYSIKKLEPLYDFRRDGRSSRRRAVLAKVQASLELAGHFDGIGAEERNTVAGYNRDDCLSAWRLRDWLEKVRSELVASGATIERPEPKSGEPVEDLTAWQQKIAALVEQLTHDVPLDRPERCHTSNKDAGCSRTCSTGTDEKRRLYWWEYYRLSDLSADELLDEKAGLSGLSLVGTVGGTQKAPIHRYHFSPQDTGLRGGEDLHQIGGEKFGTVEAIFSLNDWTVDIKRNAKTLQSFIQRPSLLTKSSGTEVLAEALIRLGEYVAIHGLVGEGPYQSARDLLLVAAPCAGGEPFKLPDEAPLAAATRIAPHVKGVFPIRGRQAQGRLT